MILIERDLVERVATAETGKDLLPLIQGAVDLEFSTIPPYLTAMLSLKPGQNREIWQILHSVVVDEMLHMAIACNLMTALGGGADIDRPGFIPTYPTALPMAINTALSVPLQPYSVATVQDVFMKIEAPENPIVFLDHVAGQETYSTIGKFYQALAAKLDDLGPGAFTGHPAHQLDAPDWFGDRLRPMREPKDAIEAIQKLVEEGEGTTKSPLDAQGDVAHYYRFEQLVRGRRLIVDEGAPEGFAFRGDPIPFDPAGVFPIASNQKLDTLTPGSQVDRLARQFAFTFTKLLKALHATFNGAPNSFDSAMGLMFELRLSGQKLCSTSVGGGNNAGPVFTYLAHSG